MPWDRTRPKASSTARGYGAAHQAERKRRVAQHTPSDPCTYCGRPLGSNKSRWHLPHKTDRSGYLPGLSCAPCNWLEGAKRGSAIGNARQRAKRRGASMIDGHSVVRRRDW